MAWEHFRHGADIGVRGSGASRKDALEEVARALTAVVADPARVRETTQVHIQCEAPDDELLVIDWLNAVIYQMSTRQMLFGRFQVTLHDHRLDAHAWGERLDPDRHEPSVEVKAATYTELSMKQRDSGMWIAQCVVDV